MTLLALFGTACTVISGPALAEAKIPNDEVSNIPKKAADNAAIQRVLNGVYQIAGVIAVIVIVVAGLQLVVGGDNPDNAARARMMIIYAAIGLVVVISAFVITQFIIRVGST